jgi:hypothetical protein
MNKWVDRNGGYISHLVDEDGEIIATVTISGGLEDRVYKAITPGCKDRSFISREAAQKALEKIIASCP